MPAKEIKELRQSGKLEEALHLAKLELDADAENVWAKRNISWVYYEYLKQNCSPNNFENFTFWLGEIVNLNLPEEDKLLFDQLSWQIGKMLFLILKEFPQDNCKCFELFDVVKSFHFSKPSEGYSFLFKAFHKTLKDGNRYIEFADWWGFQNFRAEDFQKEKMPNGKDIMSISEQAYIAYSKQLLPKQVSFQGDLDFNIEKVRGFLPKLSEVVDNYPDMQYPAYFNAKLLLALGDKENMLEHLLPFAKKKRNDFWVWEILAEAFDNDKEKLFACYCRALLCKSPDEMIVGLRLKMARILISKDLRAEAKAEIESLVNTRNEKGYKIPFEVLTWRALDWYNSTEPSTSNDTLYKEYAPYAEAILFSDLPEISVIVEFVNREKKMLNFIASEKKFGYFKYDRFLSDVKVGEILKVRIQGGKDGGMHQIYTMKKCQDDEFKKRFIKSVKGVVKIPEGKSFGFIEDVFISPAFVSINNLKDGSDFSSFAIKSYNKEKGQWGWKLI
jgi:hypothetical protein